MIPSKQNYSYIGRKIPGPASKTLRRSEQPRKQQEPGPSHKTLNVSVSSSPAFRLPIKRSQSTEDMSSLPQSAATTVVARPTSSPLPPAKRTSCLLCCDPVVVPNEDAKTAKRRTLLIKSLCFHCQLGPIEIPKECTMEMFPFCHVCERLVEQIHENEKIISAAQDRISKGLGVIERTVADAELLRSTMNVSGSSAMASTEAKKCVKLREAILNGYKTKLMMRQKLRENLVTLGNELKDKQPFCSHTAVFHDKAINLQYASVASSNPNPSPTPSQTETVSINAVPVDTGMESIPNENEDGGQEREDSSRRSSTTSSVRLPNQLISLQRQPQKQPEDMQSATRRSVIRNSKVCPVAAVNATSAPSSSPVVAAIPGIYNANACTMVIPNVCTGSETPSATPPAPIRQQPPVPQRPGQSRPSLTRPNSNAVIVKQEPRDGGQVFAPVPVPPGKRKRRTLFQGIEIVRVTDPESSKVYLQCSVCRMAIPIKGTAPGMSSFQRMTGHIMEKHLGKRRKRAIITATQGPGGIPASKKRQFACKVCNEVFDDVKSLYDHKVIHELPRQPTPSQNDTNDITPPDARRTSHKHRYYIQDLSCDVCGKPVKGTYNNLMVHKFSHKNNEERKAARDAGEQGARQSLLRTSFTNVRVQKQKRQRRQMGKYMLNKKVRRVKNKPGPKPNVSAGEDDPLVCPICSRRFSRPCHMALHMNGHARRSQLPNSSPDIKKPRRSSLADPKSSELHSQQESISHQQDEEPGAIQDHEENQEEMDESTPENAECGNEESSNDYQEESANADAPPNQSEMLQAQGTE